MKILLAPKENELDVKRSNCTTLRHAEQRNQARGCRRGLFERSEFRRRLD